MQGQLFLLLPIFFPVVMAFVQYFLRLSAGQRKRSDGGFACCNGGAGTDCGVDAGRVMRVVEHDGPDCRPPSA